MPDDPRLGNFVEQHLLAIQATNPVVLLTAFPAAKNEVHYKEEPFPQVQVLYKKRFSLLSHHQALKKGYRFLRSQGHQFDFAHLHVCHPSGIAFLGFLRKLPFVVSEHYSGYQAIRHEEWSKLGQKLARLVFNKARLILPVSKALGQTLSDFGVNQRFKVIGNVVNTALFNYQGSPSSKEFSFLHISSLQEHTKNILGLLRAFKAYQEAGGKAKLKIGGDGDTGTLKKQVESAGIDFSKVEILEAMSSEEVSAQMQASHCFVLFSRVENQPVVLLEALCSGRPFIATKVGGIPEIGDASNCLLIDSGDENALTQSLFRMEKEYAQYKLSEIAEKAAALHGKAAISAAFAEVYANVRP